MAAREPDPVTDPLCDADPLARALAKLRPVQTGLDPQRLLFLAGQAERDRTVSFWRRVSVAQLAALLLLGGVGSVYLLNEGAPKARNADRDEFLPTEGRGLYSMPGSSNALEVAPPPRPASEAPPDRYYGIPQGFARAEPDDLSPEDRARWLVLRNDVLIAGLGLLPSPTRLDRPAWDPLFGDPHVLTNQRLLEPPTPPRNPPED